MSAKIAVIIGDYSNGWSDAIIVQDVGNFNQKDCAKDRDFVRSVLAQAVGNVINTIEAHEVICPKPQDEPCCDKFKEWAKELLPGTSVKHCPFCGTKITPAREKKFFNGIKKEK